MKKVYIFTIGALLSVCLGFTQNFYAAAAAVAKENQFTECERELGEKLVRAAVRRNLPEVERLINLEAPINFIDKDGYTALMYATDKGAFFIAKALINAGANVNQQSLLSGVTALMQINGYGENIDDIYDIIEKFLNAGAQVNLKDAMGYTALSRAVWRGDIRVVKLLILAGADPDIQDKQGNTAWTISILRNPWKITREQMNVVIENALAERQQRAKHISSTLEREQNIPSSVARIIGEYEGSITPRAPRAAPIEAGEGEVEEKEGGDIRKQKEQKNLEDID